MKLLRIIPFAAAALLLASCASRKHDLDKAMKDYNRTFEKMEKNSKKQKKTTDKSFGTTSNSTW